MLRRRLPAGFIVPAQPVERDKPPVGAGWVHEIKHDGIRLLVRRDGTSVRLFTRKGNDWSDRFPAISAAADKLEASSFTIDGEAVVIGPDGLAQFDQLRRRASAGAAILYAFDLIEHDGVDLRARPFVERKAALANLLRGNEHIAKDGPTVFAHACKLGAEGIVSKRVDAAYRLSVGAALSMDQGPQPCQHRRAAGTQRELEQMNLMS